MKISTRKLAHSLLFFTGLVLIAAGIATHTKGAPILGLIVAAVNDQLYQVLNQGQAG